MDTSDLRADLLAAAPTLVASKWIFERTPHIFGSDHDSYVLWKHDLARLLSVDPLAIHIVGSAATGASFSPYKPLRPFGEESDVDVAVISAHCFNVVWNWLRGLGSERYRFAKGAQDWIEEHRKRLLYWGVIATDRLLPLTPLSDTWVSAFEACSKRSPVNGRTINARLYVDFEAFRSYHINGIGQLREKLLSEGA